MRSEIRYVCEKCNVAYDTIEAAEECERSHQTPYAPYQHALEPFWQWECGESAPQTIYLPFKNGNTTWITTYRKMGNTSSDSPVRKALDEEIERQSWWEKQFENNP